VNDRQKRYRSAEEVEAAFYAAFARCDVQGMMALWAEEEAFCAHPGSRPLLGIEAVRRSWTHIFEGARPPTIRTELVHRVTGREMAVHIVEEQVGLPDDPSRSAVVLATNIYRRGEHGWRMVSHQGAVLPVAPVRRPTLQ